MRQHRFSGILAAAALVFCASLSAQQKPATAPKPAAAASKPAPPKIQRDVYAGGTAGEYGWLATVWKNGKVLHSMSEGMPKPAGVDCLFVSGDDVWAGSRPSSSPATTCRPAGPSRRA